MRFTCASADLMNGLSIATRALSARSPLPIFEGVLLESCDQGLKLTCSDSSLSIVTRVSATIEEEGKVVLPGRLFSEVVRKMPTGEVDGRVSQNFSAVFRCMGSRTTIAGQSAENFPERPEINAECTVELSQPVLKDMIRQTSFAISSDESRMILTGSLLEIENGEARLVALDGFRLAIRLQEIASSPRMNAVIPGKVLSEVAKILSDDENELVSLTVGGNQLLAGLGETEVYAQLIEGEYIKYRQIMPRDWKTRVKVNRGEMAQCIDRASLMAREGKSNLVKLSIHEGRMVITSNSEMGDVYEELSVGQEGEGLDIAFNVKYMSDVVRAVDDDELYLCFNSSVSPCVINPTQGNAFTYLVLPVRVNA